MEDREVHLLAEVNRIQDDGARILTERRVKANELLDRAKRIKAMSDREKVFHFFIIWSKHDILTVYYLARLSK